MLHYQLPKHFTCKGPFLQATMHQTVRCKLQEESKSPLRHVNRNFIKDEPSIVRRLLLLLLMKI